MIRRLGRTLVRAVRLAGTFAAMVAMVAYLVIVRSFLFLTALLLFLYFASGTTGATRLMDQAVSEALAGSVSIGSLQWGPLPGDLHLADVVVRDPAGDEVIDVPAIDVDIDVLATTVGLLRWAMHDSAPMSVVLRRVNLVEPWLRVAVNAEGRLGIAQAFSPRKAPVEKRPPKPVDFRIGQLSLLRASAEIETPAFAADIDGMRWTSDFSVTGFGHMAFALLKTAHMERVDVALAVDGEGPRGLSARRLPIRQLSVDTFAWQGKAFETDLRIDDLEGGTLVLRAALDLGRAPIQWAADLDVQLPAVSSLLPSLSAGWVGGDVNLVLEAMGTAGEATAELRLRSGRLQVGGVGVEDLHIQVGLEPVITPAGDLTHRVLVDRVVGNLLGGTLRLDRGRLHPRWARSVDGGPALRTSTDFTGRITLAGINPYALASARKLGLDLSFLSVTEGRVDGSFRVSGDRFEHDGSLRLTAAVDSLDLRWGGISGLPLGKHIHLGGRAGWFHVPGATSPEGATEAATTFLGVEDLVLTSDDDRLQVTGSVQLPSGDLEARLWAAVPEIGDLLEPLGVQGVGGALVLEEAELSGTLFDPLLDARVFLRGGRVPGLGLGDLSTDLSLAEGTLDVRRFKVRAPWGRVDFAGDVRLWRGGWKDPDPHMPFHIRRLTARGVQLQRLLPGVGVSTTVSLDADGVRGEAHDVLGTLRGRGRIETSGLAAGSERVRQVRATLRADRRTVAVENARVILDTGDEIRASASMNKRSRTFRAHLQTDGLPFAAIRFFAEAGVPIHGRISADIHAEGTLKRPSVIGTIGLEDFAFEPAFLGDATLNLSPGEGGRIDITAVQSFEGLEILEGTHVDLGPGGVKHVLILAGAKDADLFGILPMLAVPDLSVGVTGLVEVELSPGDPDRPFEIRVDAMENDVRLGLYDGDFVYRNLSSLYLVIDPQGVHIHPLTLGRDLDDAVTLCGRLGGAIPLDLQIAGRLNLDLLRPLRGAFSMLSGSFVVGDDPFTADALGETACLPLDGGRVFWVRGMPDSPGVALSGRFESLGVRMTPRNFGREIQLADGVGPILRAGDEPGSLRILLPDDAERRIRGDLEGGRFQVSGELSLGPDGLDAAQLSLVGTDIFFAQPGQMNLTFNPDLDLRVEHFMDDETRVLRLGGEVLISEGLFYRNFDRISQALGAGSEDGGGAYSEPVTERIPWLKDLALDLAVKTRDFRIKSAFPLGQADLDTQFDLRVGGTLDALEIHRRVEILPGGQVLYRVIRRDFEIVQGTIDFRGDPGRPLLDIEAQTEVTYLPEAVSDDVVQEERQVNVSIRISGVPPNLQLEFWSKDATNFTAADLQSLILTGRPRDEAGSIQDRVGVSVDFGKLVNDIIKSPIVEALNVTVGAESVTTRMIYRLGRAMRLKTRVVQEADETRVSAGFQFELTDSLSLEGNLQRTDRATNPTQTYEARFKYRIPLE